MAAHADTASMALFCDFENIALGVRDAKYEKFDIKPILERLLAKGSIVVKKAYCDWERYKGFKATMHEANFELIEIPHVRQSGKNSADIRLVVDALDLCYTKSHVDTFVIISGDSDFSPLVSKLRENAKQVIGVGVKQSCSDLLIANCDEFIYYDDLVRDREAQRGGGRRENREAQPRRTAEEEGARREEMEARKTKAVELGAATFADLIAVRGDQERLWASVLKEAIKRRNPGFNESYYGFRSFGNLLEEAAARGLLGFGRDEKSGAYVTRAPARPVVPDTPPPVAQPDASPPVAAASGSDAALAAEASASVAASAAAPRRRSRGGRKSAAAEAPQFLVAVTVATPAADRPPAAPSGAATEATSSSVAEAPEAAKSPRRKAPTRSSRPRKPKAAPEGSGE